MSDEGERACPLCAEEMDLTDQQLKPCKCGYDICVWCWHRIMDIAEKDNTEGRCPACRTPYNKEKIVATASKCERLVTGMSVEKKQKSQKGKIKTSEGRKDLGAVRVIQRNLVYIVGLPLDLADEDLLQQKDYFGQYGKVLKVSISRTAAGAIQQFPNSTCSVYITYSKEEEAVRSIQSTHGFILEGCPLRACFGTTKYCHAWLRNMPCMNVDCLYLHEFGMQEDRFSKDDIVSAYTRNRVQQITGATNDMQRRSGNLLPPPADEYSNNNTSAWPKPNNPANSMKVSPPNSNSGRSVALPAAASRGTCPSNSQPIASNVANINGPTKQQTKATSKQQTKACKTTPSFSSAVASPFDGDDLVNKCREESNNVQNKGNLGNPVSMKKGVGNDHRRTLSETPVTTTLFSSSTSSSLISTSPKNKNVSRDQERIRNLSVDMPSESMTKGQRFQPSEDSQLVEPLTNNEAEKTTKHAVSSSDTRKMSDLVSDLQKKVAEISISEAKEDYMSLNDIKVSNTSYLQNPPQSSPQHTYVSSNDNLDPPSLDQNLEKAPQHACTISNGHSYFHGTEGGRSQTDMLKDHSNAALDLGENSIISNILSMDFDPWDESLTSAQNLATFLGESDKQVLSARKTKNNQSRFSFAREDECIDQGSNYAPNVSNFGHGDNSIYQDNKLSGGNGFSSFSFEESNHFATTYSQMSENKISVPRAQVSAPPGFSGPIRAPPPGFTSHERMEQNFDNISGNHNFGTSSLPRKTHETSTPVNMGDLEFMDPAILAVGGRVPNSLHMRSSNFPSQMNSFENDVRFQLLMQTSFSQQNPRFTQLANKYQQTNLSSYQRPTSFQHPMSSPMSNGLWNGGNDIGMADLFRNERMGFNRYYSGHEETKFQLPTSGDLYNRTFGI